MNEQFDKELETIPELKWLPWIGENFCISKPKIMIFGESIYLFGNDDDKYVLRDKLYSRQIIEYHILQKNNNIRLLKNFGRAIFQTPNLSVETTKGTWCNLCYNVLVQRALESIQKRPTYEDYYNGWQVFFNVQKLMQPDYCIFLGVESSNYLKDSIKNSECSLLNLAKQKKVGSTYPRTASIKQNEHETQLVFIKHPSAHFSWRKWGDYLYQQIPEVIKSIRSYS